jgi:hypothetical protein
MDAASNSAVTGRQMMWDDRVLCILRGVGERCGMDKKILATTRNRTQADQPLAHRYTD